MNDKSQTTTEIGKSQEEIPPNIVEQPNEPHKSQRVRKQKELGYDEIDSQIISFCLVEGNREDVIRKIPIILQIKDDPKTYKKNDVF